MPAPKFKIYAKDRDTKRIVEDDRGRWWALATVWPGKFPGKDDVQFDFNHPALLNPRRPDGKMQYFFEQYPPRPARGAAPAPDDEERDATDPFAT